MVFLQKTFRSLNTSFLKGVALLETHPFESLFALPLVLFYGWYVLAVTGLFHPPFVLFFFFLIGLAALRLLSKKPALCNFPNALLLVFLLFFAVLALTTHPIEPVAEGRDQGTFTNAALLLSSQYGIPFTLPEAKPFFELYGPGKALNFPGFAYTAAGNLIPEFPFGYITWLAGFVTTFGLFGLTLANTVLYLLSGLLFYALAKRVVEPFWAFMGTLVTLGGFLPLWFLSFTLTENLALFLFLLTAECVLRFQINKDRVTLFLALGSAFALALTRIEGWAVLAVTVALVMFKKNTRKWLQTYVFSRPLWSMGAAFFAALLTAWTLYLNYPYYKAILKALNKSTEESLAVNVLGQETLPLYQVFWEYGLLIPFLLGLLSCLYFWKTRRFHLLVPFFLALPTLPYLFLPHITMDAPWMLRRFLFSLYPMLILSTLWAVSLLMIRSRVTKTSLVWLFVFVVILIGQIPALRYFTETRYQATLVSQVAALSQTLHSEDLILIDREATGDNFMIPARTLSTLFGRPAVYFFNPHDLAKIDTKDFERVILVTPQNKVSFYTDILDGTASLIGEFTFTNDHSFLDTTLEGEILPSKNVIQTPVVLLEIY